MTTSEMQPISAALAGFLRIDGTAPCSLGCGRDAERVLVGDRPVPTLCSECAAVADAKLEEELRQAEVDRLMEKSGVTRKMALWSFDSYPGDSDGKKLVLEARSWIATWAATSRDEPVGNLLLIGNVGTGKTGLAWCMVREIIERHQTRARLVNWRVLLADMQEQIHLGRNQMHEQMGLDRIPVLVIDDLGSERTTDWRREELANLIERRENNLLPTIVTSNFTRKELVERLGHDDSTVGERIMSRLVEGATVLRFKGPDRRVLEARAA